MQKIISYSNGHYLLVKGTVNQKYYQYLCTKWSPSEVHKAFANKIKKHIDGNTIVVGDFNTTLSPLGSTTRWNINRDESLK